MAKQYEGVIGNNIAYDRNNERALRGLTLGVIELLAIVAVGVQFFVY